MRIYLDSCCYNRPFDDQSQERVHMEGEAILGILTSERKDIQIVGSEVLGLEIDRMTDKVKKSKVTSLYSIVNIMVPYSDAVLARSKVIRAQSNIRSFDALHVAAAENANADVMLTTDDKLEKACANLDLYVRVINPLKFILEMIDYE